MPTISVKKELLFAALGQRYEDKDFEELCFDFGIELDDVTTEQAEKDKMKGVQTTSSSSRDEEVIYKIEVGANRYDLLCLEGIATALKVFLEKEQPPVFKTAAPTLRMNVEPSIAPIRPFVVCAVLRNISFNAVNMKSFIDIQDKLHQNICRQRSLVSIGTHDLDTIQGPFSYKALTPKEIKFAPLNRTEVVDGEQLMTLLDSDLHLKAFLPLIRDLPAYPVIYDSKDVVLSLPPIINGDHSKITLNTKNVFIEVTATDRTKAEIVLNIITTMFVQYCQDPTTVEQVEVVYPDGTVTVHPNLESKKNQIDISYINGILGLQLGPEKIARLLTKMLLKAEPSASDPKILDIHVPPTRSDVLHGCDIVEDVAIAYGYNNLDIVAPKTTCYGSEQPLNSLSDLLRVELASAGYLEALSLILGSNQDNFVNTRREDVANKAVRISNANASEFELARTSLLPGLLKTIVSNRDLPLPFKLYEVSDVVVKSDKSDVGAVNERHLCAVFCDKTSGFENIHGLLNFVMQKLEIDHSRYYLESAGFTDGAYFPGCAANIIFDDQKVGVIGMVHPQVLNNFDLVYPCSAVELNVHYFV